MKKFTAFLLLTAVLITALGGCTDKNEPAASSTDTNLPGVTEQMNTADYWISKLKSADAVMLSASDITKLNQQITNQTTSGVVDLVTYPSQLSEEQLKGYLGAFTMPTGDLYSNEAVKYDTAYFDGLVASLNYDAISSSNKMSYAILAANANLRYFPTASPAFTDAATKDTDVFQQAILPVGEPVVVLHNSTDQDWFYVQSRSMRGWVHRDALIFMEKGSWASYIATDKFIVVTAPSITLEPNPYSTSTSGLTLYMGTRLPLYNEAELPETVDNQGTAGSYIVKYPSKDRYGYLEFKPVLIPMSADVSVGYLPYTQENVLDIAFQMLGKRYCIGGIYGGRDNAGFIADLYKPFGIYLPATTAQQAAVLSSDTTFEELATSERSKALEKVSACSLLFSKDQGFLYLGLQGGKPFVLHPSVDFYIDNLRYIANSTVVSGLDLVRKDGTTFLDALTIAKKLALVSAEDADKK